MTRFTDGPADGITLFLQPKCVAYLRLARDRFDTLGNNNGWTAIDRLRDGPTPRQSVYVYDRVGLAGTIWVRHMPSGRRVLYHLGDYRLAAEQPDDATMRSHVLWTRYYAARLAAERSADGDL
jgi:hypothetical protein